MAQESPGGGEKTEKPTPKRLEDAAKKGDILQSRELGTAMVVMAGLAGLVMTGPSFMGALQQMLADGLRVDNGDIGMFEPGRRALHLLAIIALPLAIILVITLVAAIAAPALLGSLGFRPNAFAPKPSKLNPAAGLKRMFGTHGLVELLKSIAKVVVIGSIGYYLVRGQFPVISAIGKTGIGPAMAQLGAIFTVVILTMAGSLFLIAGIDVPAQFLQRSRRLNMTKQEVKEEHKQSEGSPEAKGQMRARQMAASRGSIRAAVDDASVILTNPTHFAVVLRYQPGRDGAPVVLARGTDEIAAYIRTTGEEKGVPMLQYPELTRAIYYTSRTGEMIDERLFMAVATVLAFVFRLESRMASEMDRPHIDLPEAMRFDADGQNISD